MSGLLSADVFGPDSESLKVRDRPLYLSYTTANTQHDATGCVYEPARPAV